jgi:transcriptional regulator with XRE-family HTH domain
MNTLEIDNIPAPNETLASYIRRIRVSLSLSQKELADKAGIHLQSLGKMERGKTARFNRKTQNGLAYALGIPVEYLEGIGKGVAVNQVTALKFCPECWRPGTAPDPLWMNLRAKYCFLCGVELQNRCRNCHQSITSLKHRFCPYCGTVYKSVL